MPGLTGKAKKKQSMTMPYEEDTALFIGLIFVFGSLQPHRKAMLKGDWGRCHQQAKSHLSDKCIACCNML